MAATKARWWATHSKLILPADQNLSCLQIKNYLASRSIVKMLDLQILATYLDNALVLGSDL